MNALNTAIRAKMLADTGAGGLNHASTGATGGFWQLVAPDNAGFPRIHFQKLTGTPLYSFKNLIADHVYYQISVFAVDGNEAGPVTAGRLSERAKVLFMDPVMTVTGKVLAYCRPDRDIPDGEEDDESQTRKIYRKGFLLELWLA